jgi:hypothetical protein
MWTKTVFGTCYRWNNPPYCNSLYSLETRHFRQHKEDYFMKKSSFNAFDLSFHQTSFMFVESHLSRIKFYFQTLKY